MTDHDHGSTPPRADGGDGRGAWQGGDPGHRSWSPARPAGPGAPSAWASSDTYRRPDETPVVQHTTGPRYSGYDHTRPTQAFPATAPTEVDPRGADERGAVTAPATRRGPGWLGVITVGLVMALLASLLTYGLTRAGADDAPSLPSAARNGDQADPVVTSTTAQPDWANVASAVRSSVVAISVATPQGGGQGSGIVYDGDGHVVTNNHVVEGAVGGVVQVTMADGEIIRGDIIGTDPATDLAVVKLQQLPQNLQPATIGDSGEVLVGDPVAAFGNPLGLSSTMTTGIVSALDRPVSAADPGNPNSAVVTNAIQVDAPVNPGNSGGALFDATGRVIGVTSSIATTSASSGSVGLGFAIPSDLVQRVVPQLIESGRAEHAYLGVSMNDGQATVDGVTKAGANVLRVEPGTPAAEAGIRAGDVIISMDGKSVAGAESLTGYVRAHSSGDQVTLAYVRGGSQEETQVTLATRPDNL